MASAIGKLYLHCCLFIHLHCLFSRCCLVKHFNIKVYNKSIEFLLQLFFFFTLFFFLCSIEILIVHPTYFFGKLYLRICLIIYFNLKFLFCRCCLIKDFNIKVHIISQFCFYCNILLFCFGQLGFLLGIHHMFSW